MEFHSHLLHTQSQRSIKKYSVDSGFITIL